MDVYIDILFMQNMVFNYLILYAASKFAKMPVKSYRLFTGALVGTAYVVLVLLLPAANIFYTTLGKICLSFLIIALTFWKSNAKSFFRALICFYVSTFVFAGASFAFLYLSNSGGFIRNGVYYIFTKSSMSTMLLIAAFAAIIVRIFYEIIRDRSIRGKIFIPVNISIDGKSAELSGLVDTGNSLHDPISNLPVVVVEVDALGGLLPEEMKNIVTSSNDIDLDCLGHLESASGWISKIRLVPFSSLGKENGMLLGFKPDKLIVGEENAEATAIVCICKRKLSKNHAYTALLSPELI